MSGDILLNYSNHLGWHYISNTFYIKMSDATFQRHVNSYLHQQGITEPSLDQLIQARQYCRRVSFWEGCTDPEIRRRVPSRYGR